MDDNTTLAKIAAAIVYFEDAIKENDEIIEDCSPALAQSLADQKEHFVVALAALRFTAKCVQPKNETTRH